MTEEEALARGYPVTDTLYRNEETETQIDVTTFPDGTFDLCVSMVDSQGVGDGYSLNSLTPEEVREIANKLIAATYKHAT